MANPQIVYDPGTGPITLDFPEVLSDLSGGGRVPERVESVSEGGVFAVHLQHFFEDWTAVIDKMPLDDADILDFIDDLEPFWAWAGRGGGFSFAVDTDDAIEHTLDGAAAAGQNVIPLDSTTDVNIGTRYFVESALDGWQREVGQVVTITAGASVAVLNALKYSYLAGDKFRSKLYFPQCVALQRRHPMIELPHRTLNFQLQFRTFNELVMV